MIFSALDEGQGTRVNSAQMDLEVSAEVFQVPKGGMDCRQNRMCKKEMGTGQHGVQ